VKQFVSTSLLQTTVNKVFLSTIQDIPARLAVHWPQYLILWDCLWWYTTVIPSFCRNGVVSDM